MSDQSSNMGVTPRNSPYYAEDVSSRRANPMATTQKKDFKKIMDEERSRKGSEEDSRGAVADAGEGKKVYGAPVKSKNGQQDSEHLTSLFELPQAKQKKSGKEELSKAPRLIATDADLQALQDEGDIAMGEEKSAVEGKKGHMSHAPSAEDAAGKGVVKGRGEEESHSAHLSAAVSSKEENVKLSSSISERPPAEEMARFEGKKSLKEGEQILTSHPDQKVDKGQKSVQEGIDAETARSAQAGRLVSRQEEAVAAHQMPRTKESGDVERRVPIKKENEMFSIFSPQAKKEREEGVDLGDFRSPKGEVEYGDLSRMNQAAPSIFSLQGVATSASAEVSPIVVRQSVRELVNQIASEIAVMHTAGKTETVVVLRQPPLFEGARIVMTEFDSAKMELNLSFENLKNSAQHLVDMQQNRAQLLNGLERQGYHVQIFSSTTYDEPRFIASSDLPDRQERESRDGEQPEEEQKRRQRESFS